VLCKRSWGGEWTGAQEEEKKAEIVESEGKEEDEEEEVESAGPEIGMGLKSRRRSVSVRKGGGAGICMYYYI